MVKATLLIAFIAVITISVMANGFENALPTAAPTLVARTPEDPEDIQKHLSRASERLNHLPSAAREPAQSRIAEASRSIANIRPTDKDSKMEETFTPTAPSTTGSVSTGSTDIAADASTDMKSSSSCSNKPISALSAAIAAIVAIINALI